MDFVQNYPADTPVTMFNILKFKDQTEIEERTGESLYNRYSKNVKPLLEGVGGKLIWAGNTAQTIIGDYESIPDRILIIAYPHKQAFIDMVTSEDYKKIAGDRIMALEYGGLIACKNL